MVTAEELQDQIASHHENLEEACKGLIALANEHGGSDNITLVLLHYQKEGS